MKHARLVGFFGVVVTLAFASCTTSPFRSENDSESADRAPASVSAVARAARPSVTLVGLVPNRYLRVSGAGSKLARVVITNGIITKVEAISAGAVPDGALELKNSVTGRYDTLYPGLINLHNHTKQNNLSLWSETKGQFENRFEWRDWKKKYDRNKFPNAKPWINYDEALSNNMNPWSGYGKAVEAAAFRWTELMSLVLGTTYLQGDSSYVSDFGINRVEDRDTYAVSGGVKPRENVQAPTDVIYPDEMHWIYKEVRPLVLQGASYGKALTQIVNKYCKDLNVQDAMDPATIRRLSGMKASEAEAKCVNPPKHLTRYLTFLHSSTVGKINYLNHPNRAGVIAHVAEGARNDPYNRIEFELLKVIGLDKPGFNVVHGVGIDAEGFKHMGKRGMGLIWSPFSNLLLYGETADIKAAKTAGVTIALGSDWTPTGTKSVLEELKIARAYVKKAGIAGTFSDEELYKMVTENPAKLLGHLETKEGDGYHDIGVIAPDAMGSVIAVSTNDTKNVYTNLMVADAKDVNLVVVDGKVQYGNESYLEQYARTLGKTLDEIGVEKMPEHFAELSKLKPSQVDAVPNKDATKDQKAAHLVKLARHSALKSLKPSDNCKFPEQKYLVHQNSQDKVVLEFAETSGLNLDRYADIQKLLGINVMTQNVNISGGEGANKNAAPQYFAPLFTCNDPPYQKRLKNFVSVEVPKNRAARTALRRERQHGADPKKLAELYGLTPSGI